MKIAIAVSEDGSRVVGHAGKATHWLRFDCAPGQPPVLTQRVRLAHEQLPHHFRDDPAGHPLHGVALLVAASAGDAFVRHMAGWGAEVMLTGEDNPRAVLDRIAAAEPLPSRRFDVTTLLCTLRDLLSRH